MLKSVLLTGLLLMPWAASHALFGKDTNKPDADGLKCFAQALELPGYMISGKGVSASPSEARALALQEIAQGLSVSVSSTVQSSMVAAGDRVSREDRSEATLTSDVELDSVTEVCTVIGRDGRYYRLFASDSRPALQQIVSKLQAAWNGLAPGKLLWQGHDALVQSRAVAELNRRLTDESGEVTVPVTVSLDYHSGHWVLTLNETSQILRHTDVADFLSFPQAGDNLAIINARTGKELAGRQLQQGQEFYFRTETPPGSFVQLLNIYEDGRVALLNNVQSSEAAQRVPAGGVFEAVLLEEDKSTRDIYLMLSSSRRFSTPALEQLVAWGGKVEGEGAYQLDALLGWLSTQSGQVTLSAIEVVTRPR